MVMSTTLVIGRWPAARQARLQPRRRRADRHVLEGAGGEARAQVGALDADLDARRCPSPAGCGSSRPRRRREVGAGGGVDLAGDPVDAEAVGAVGRDLELEDVGGDRQRLRRAACPAAPATSSTMIPAWSAPMASSSSARIIPADSTPRSLALPSFVPSGITAPGPRHGDGLAGRDVRRAADDLGRLGLAHVDRADAEPVGVGVLLGASARGRPRSSPGRRRRGGGCASTFVPVIVSRVAELVRARRPGPHVLARASESGTLIRTAPGSAGRCRRAGAGRGPRA